MVLPQRLIQYLEPPFYMSLIYFGESLSYYTLFSLFENESSMLIAIWPIIVTFLGILPVYCMHYLYKPLYPLIYNISGFIHGYLLNLFLVCIAYQVVSLFIKLSFFVSFIFVIVSPIIMNIYGYLNAQYIRITNIKVKYQGISEKKKIVHISDWHLGCISQKKTVQKLVDKIKSINPDSVAITGDWVDDSMHLEKEWLEPFNELSMPIFFITGNHDETEKSYVLPLLMENTKIKYIGNKSLICKGINYIGINFQDNVRKKLKELQENKYNNNDVKVPNILLYHVPEIYPKELEKMDIYMHLAGHTHAGQNIPVHFPTYLWNACLYGLYPNEKNDRFVYVTSGIGTAILPIRTYSISEIAVIEIEE